MKKSRAKRLRANLLRARFALIQKDAKRADFLRRHHLLAHVGDNLHWATRWYPVDGGRLYIHDNVSIARSVNFIMHDEMHLVLNDMGVCDHWINQNVGCIEIMDNVAIGSGVQICPNVRIGPNAIVGAGAVVTKDVPPNSVVAGVPARVIGSFDDFADKRIAMGDRWGGAFARGKDEASLGRLLCLSRRGYLLQMKLQAYWWLSSAKAFAVQ